jgi:hypothetical protein
MDNELKPTSNTTRLSKALLTPQVGLATLTVAAILLTVWSYSYFGKYRPFADLIDQSTNSPLAQIGLQMDDAVISVRGQGRLRLRVAARQITVSRDRRSITVDGLHDGILYDNRERPEVQFDAGRMVYDTPTGDMASTADTNLVLTGGITASTVANDGFRLAAAQATWNSVTGIVQSLDSVNITFAHASGTAVADGVRYDTRTRNLSVARMHGTLRIAKLVQ